MLESEEEQYNWDVLWAGVLSVAARVAHALRQDHGFQRLGIMYLYLGQKGWVRPWSPTPSSADAGLNLCCVLCGNGHGLQPHCMGVFDLT